MALSDPLNSRQLQVLEWVAAGCPADRWEDSTYKTTAIALQSRRLITVSKRGGSWLATIEPAGTFYLEHGTYPDNHFQSRYRTTKPKRIKGVHARPPVEAEAALPLPMTGPELIDKLRTDGELTVRNPAAAVRAAWRRTINAAQLCSELPADAQITFKGRDTGDLVIGLRTRATSRPAFTPVPEIDDSTAWPTAAATFPTRPTLIDVSTSSHERATRIVHRLAVEAANRDCVLQPRPDNTAGFRLSRGNFTRDYDLTEEYDEAEVIPEDAVARKKYAWQRVSPEQRPVPSGRLVISHGEKYSRSFWADRKRWTLESKLPEILADFEMSATSHEDRLVRYKSEKKRLKREWEQALINAKQAYIDDYNRDRLTKQVQRFDQAQCLRRYAAEIRQLAASEPDTDLSFSMLAWASFAQAQAEETDPLRHPRKLSLKEPPSMREWDFQSFMPRGMDVYAPPEPRL